MYIGLRYLTFFILFCFRLRVLCFLVLSIFIHRLSIASIQKSYPVQEGDDIIIRHSTYCSH